MKKTKMAEAVNFACRIIGMRYRILNQMLHAS